MFSYYGAKSKIVSWYPKPKYKTIVEPFAGSARYALHHAKDHDVVIVEKDPTLIGVWRWLLSAQISDIASLPILQYKEPIPEISPKGARDFLSFMSNQGSEHPRNVAGSKGGFKVKSWDRVIATLPLIKNWTLIEGDYTLAPDIEATWFIDPPYVGQRRYRCGRDLDYQNLAEWVKSRRGQVIVCENDTAQWLPFRPLGVCAGQRKTSKLRNEGIWTNDEADGKNR